MGFAKNHKLDISKDCDITLTDASGNEMTVVGSTMVWLRPSRMDGRSNTNGEYIEFNLVVNEEMGDYIFLGRDDLAKLGVIDDDFPRVKHRRIFKVEARSAPAEATLKVNKLKKNYSEIFGELTSDRYIRLSGPAKIHMKESNNPPFRARTARRPSKAL